MQKGKNCALKYAIFGVAPTPFVVCVNMVARKILKYKELNPYKNYQFPNKT